MSSKSYGKYLIGVCSQWITSTVASVTPLQSLQIAPRGLPRTSISKHDEEFNEHTLSVVLFSPMVVKGMAARSATNLWPTKMSLTCISEAHAFTSAALQHTISSDTV